MKSFLDTPFLSMMPVMEFGSKGPAGMNLGFMLRWTTMREVMTLGKFMLAMTQKP